MNKIALLVATAVGIIGFITTARKIYAKENPSTGEIVTMYIFAIIAIGTMGYLIFVGM